MIYTGKIEKFTEIQTDDSCANPRKNFGWICSCGENKDEIETYQQAEGQLDSHMRQHYTKDNRDRERMEEVTDQLDKPELATQYGIKEGSTLTMMEVEEYRRQLEQGIPLFDKDRGIYNATLIEIKLDGKPTGEWSWKCQWRGHDYSTREQAIDAFLRHVVRKRPRVHAHEESSESIERPPDRDASRDVRHTIPIDPGKSGNALDVRSMLLVTFVDDPDFPGCTLGESKKIQSRWDLFTDEEIDEIREGLDNLGSEGREPLRSNLEDEINHQPCV